jgi:hypothetical protein
MVDEAETTSQAMSGLVVPGNVPPHQKFAKFVFDSFWA